jgi:hypothetical protein
MLRGKKSSTPVYALNIVSDESEHGKTAGTAKKMMEKAVVHAGATEQTIIPITRFDISISNGIVYTLKEQHITDVVIGLHRQSDQEDFFGQTAERILKNTSETVYIYRSVQPFNTLKRMVVTVTSCAELEPGFSHWVGKLYAIAKQSGVMIEFYGNRETIKELREQMGSRPDDIRIGYHEFSNWEDFLVFTREVKKNDLFVIISSRKGHVSFQPHLEKLPYFLSNYFTETSFMLIFPQQVERGIKMDDVQFFDSSLAETISEKVGAVGKAGGIIRRIFKKKK